MSARPLPTTATETREQRIETILQQLRPKIDAAVRKLVERAVDVPEAKEARSHRLRVSRCGGRTGKKGHVGCSVTCSLCDYVAKFHSYQQRRVVTVHGELKVRRAYYYCGRCHQSYLPYDDVRGLVDEISPGLMPLVTLAGKLVPFADAAEDAETLCRGPVVAIDGAALHRGGGRTVAGAAERGTHGAADAAGAEVDGTASSRPASGVRWFTRSA